MNQPDSFRKWWTNGVHGYETGEYGRAYTLAKEAWEAACAEQDAAYERLKDACECPPDVPLKNWVRMLHSTASGVWEKEGGITNMNCPINEQTRDGWISGRCCFLLPDGKTCHRHGDVSEEVERFRATGRMTLENVMRKRKGWALLGKGGD